MSETRGDDLQAAVPLMTFQGSALEDSDFIPSEEEEDPLESVLNRMKYRPQVAQPHDFWPSIILSGSLCLVFGFVLSYVAFVIGQKRLSLQETAYMETDFAFGSDFAKQVSEQQIIKYTIDLQVDGNVSSLSQLNHHYLNQGFDSSYMFNYTIMKLQSDPRYETKVNLLKDESGKIHAFYVANISTTIPGKTDVVGSVVYVNFGLEEDWQQLEKDNISVADQIVVARTGKLWPEQIALAVAQRGGKALLLYSGDRPNFPFWFPHSVTSNIGGVFQENQDFPIPVASLNARDAEDLLRIMMGDIEGSSWDRSQPNRSRRGLLQLQANLLPHTSVISDIVAVLGGREEPDRYVIIGAHRTTMGNETAALMEVARIFGKMKSLKGWRPRRTIILASWGGEGSVGAAAWVAQFQQSLRGRIVSYVNLQQLGPDEDTTLVQGSALLKQAVRKVVSLMHEVPVLDSKTDDLPKLGLRASATPFIHLTSSPCLNIRYTNISILNVALRVGIMVSWLLADASLLPCDVRSFADSVADSLVQLHTKYDGMMSRHNLSIQSLDQAVKEFTETAARFQQHLDKKTMHTGVQLREINDQIRQLVSAFVLPYNLETRDEFEWPSSMALAGGPGFGQLQDLLFKCTFHVAEHASALQLHAERLALALRSASALLLPPTRLQ